MQESSSHCFLSIWGRPAEAKIMNKRNKKKSEKYFTILIRLLDAHSILSISDKTRLSYERVCAFCTLYGRVWL